MSWRWICAAAFALGALGCADDSGGAQLTEAEVTDLPTGDATGAALTGAYQFETVTTDCAGLCEPVSYLGFTLSPCDVGARNDEAVDVTQEDGALQLDVQSSVWASRLSGGVWADGSYDVGGYKTENGGSVRFISQARGTVTDEGVWDGVLTLRTAGSFEGQAVDCTATVDLTGAPR